MTASGLALGRRTYLDSNLYIYLLEGVPVYRRLMADLVGEIDQQDISVIASELTFVEILPSPVREGRRRLVASYLELMQRTPRFTLVQVDRQVIERAVQLRADLRLRSMDALHVATALVHGCETFLTNDERLAVPDDIRLVTLKDLAATKPAMDRAGPDTAP